MSFSGAALLHVGNARGEAEGQHDRVDNAEAQRTGDGLGLDLPGAERRDLRAAQNVDWNLQSRLLLRPDDAAVHVEIIRKDAADGVPFRQAVAVKGLHTEVGVRGEV